MSYALAAGVLVGGALLCGGFWAGIQYESGSRAREDLREQKTLQSAQAGAAAAIAKIEVNNVEVKQKLQTIIQERVVYRDCQHDADSLRLINEALTGRSSGNRKLPETHTDN